jgi:hypothetical protein
VSERIWNEARHSAGSFRARKMQVREASRIVLLHLLRRSLGRRSPHGLHADRLDLLVEPEGDAFLINATYHLRCPGESNRRSVAIDLTRSWLTLVAAKSDVADTAQSWIERGASPAFLPFHLKADQSWEGGSITLTLRWQPDPAAHAGVLIPDRFPALLQRTLSHAIPAQRITIRSEGAKQQLRLGGVPESPSAVVGFGRPLLQALLVPAAIVAHEQRDPDGARIMCTNAVVEDLSPGERQRISSLLTTILQFHSRELGLAIRPTLAVKTPYEWTGPRYLPHGAFINGTPWRFGLLGAADPSDFNLADQVVGNWFGAGIRITGRGAKEIEAGLTLAQGLRWIEFVEEDAALERSIANLRKGAKRNRISQWLEGMRDELRDRLCCRNALALYEALRADPAARRLIKDLVREHWGQAVPSGIFRDSFRGVGVHLD